eukprot:1748377-Alexandrium_andersonii.AAC.1
MRALHVAPCAAGEAPPQGQPSRAARRRARARCCAVRWAQQHTLALRVEPRSIGEEEEDGPHGPLRGSESAKAGDPHSADPDAGGATRSASPPSRG